MSNDIIQILINYIGIPSIVATILAFILKKYLSGQVDHYFHEKLTLFKHQLDLSAEAERFNYQRKIQDFTLFTVKKHEKYIRLHELLLEAEARICGFYGAKVSLAYKEYNESDFRRLMTNGKFPNGKIEEIMKIWQLRNKESAIKEMEKFFRLIELRDADKSYWELKNHFALSKLYLSDIIHEKFQSCLSSLGALLANYETVEQIPFEARREIRDIIDEGNKIRNTIRPQIEELIIILRKELSVGYYT